MNHLCLILDVDVDCITSSVNVRMQTAAGLQIYKAAVHTTTQYLHGLKFFVVI